MNFMFLPLKHKIHIFELTPNLLFIIWTINIRGKEIEKQSLIYILGINTNQKRREKQDGNRDVISQYDHSFYI